MSFFHKVSFTINKIFPHLRETLYVRRVKLFADGSELLKHSELQFLVVGKTASLERILQAAKNLSRRVLNRDHREDMGG